MKSFHRGNAARLQERDLPATLHLALAALDGEQTAFGRQGEAAACGRSPLLARWQCDPTDDVAGRSAEEAQVFVPIARATCTAMLFRSSACSGSRRQARPRLLPAG